MLEKYTILAAAFQFPSIIVIWLETLASVEVHVEIRWTGSHMVEFLDFCSILLYTQYPDYLWFTSSQDRHRVGSQDPELLVYTTITSFIVPSHRRFHLLFHIDLARQISNGH